MKWKCVKGTKEIGGEGGALVIGWEKHPDKMTRLEETVDALLELRREYRERIRLLEERLGKLDCKITQLEHEIRTGAPAVAKKPKKPKKGKKK